MFADGRELDAALGDDERPVGRGPYPVCEFAGLGSLCESIRKKFMCVGLAIAVDVAQSPDAVAIEHEQIISANTEAKWFVQSRCKPPPRYLAQLAAQPGDQPHVPIKRDRRRAARSEEH